MLWHKKVSRELHHGDAFEKYTVERQLGSGGMGAVYLVKHNVLDTFFALKILFPEIAQKDKQYVNRFMREAKLACKIRHQNLIAVHDAGLNKKTSLYYIVMDYVSGGSVRDLLVKEGALPVAKSLQIVTQIASALKVAHDHKMIHRDIKPDNIMFAADGTAKLADLGIAKSSGEQDMALTMEASVFGTPAYMSPEQAMDSSKVDCRADIYSLGIVLFEMIAGKLPFQGMGMVEILSSVVDRSKPVPDIREFCSDVPGDVAELIRDMTAKDLAKRISTPIELLLRLNRIQEDAQRKLKSKDIKHPIKVPIVHAPIEKTMVTLVNASESPIDKTMPTIDNPAAKGRSDNVAETIKQDAVAVPVKRNKTSRGKIVFCILSLLMLLGFGVFVVGRSQSEMPLNSPVRVAGPGVGRNEEEGQKPSEKPDENESGNSAEESPGKEKTPVEDEPSAELQPEPEPKPEPESPITADSIVVLGDISMADRVASMSSVERPYVFREAESLANWRRQLKEIIDAKPQELRLALAEHYAEAGLSLSGFETMIREAANMLVDAGIKFTFVLGDEKASKPKVRAFNDKIKELCSLRSFEYFENITENNKK